MTSFILKAVAAGLTGTVAVYGLALLGAMAHYRTTARRQGAPISWRGLGAHLLPLGMVKGRWTRADTIIYLSNKMLFTLVLPSAAAMTALAASGTRGGLAALHLTAIRVPENTLTLSIFVISSLAVRDFASFYIHVMQHRVPILWEFHKVHHAPETLIPLTTYRLHPLELFVNLLADSALLGILAGANAWMMNQDQTRLIATSVSVYAIVNMITFSPLRHSHIDLRLGRLEFLLLSPAHHRMHHSVERHHWDKNFGGMFPLWDWLWNTLEQPSPPETYRLGLPDGKSEYYVSAWKSYVTPFREIGRCWRNQGLLPTFRIGPLENHPPPNPSSGED